MCFNADNISLPCGTSEIKGRFTGISENMGHNMTFKVLSTATNKVLSRSNLRPADDKCLTLRAKPLTLLEIVKSLHEQPPSSNNSSTDHDSASLPSNSVPILDPSNLVGRTFLVNKEEEQRLRARIAKTIDD